MSSSISGSSCWPASRAISASWATTTSRSMAGAARRVENILRFERDFPGAKVIRLERNYRSTPAILGAASGLIAANKGRLGKTLWTEGEPGEKIKVQGVWDAEEEARNVATEAEAAASRRAHALREMAVLVRASFQMREFEDRFLSLGIPYRVIGGPRFYERAEIRDAMAYLRLIAQGDDDLAFERIVNRPKRGIGDASVAGAASLSRARARLPLLAAAREIADTDEVPPKARKALGELAAEFRALERDGAACCRIPSWPKWCWTNAAIPTC